MPVTTVNNGAHPADSGRHTDHVFDFGIYGYRPSRIQGCDAVAAQHGQRLARLAGRTLRHVWLAWDPDGDRCVPDWPVLLDFGAEQVEINHYKIDDVSITFNSIDPAQPISSDVGFEWRPGALPQLQTLTGQQLRHTRVLEPVDTGIGDEPIALASPSLPDTWPFTTITTTTACFFQPADLDSWSSATFSWTGQLQLDRTATVTGRAWCPRSAGPQAAGVTTDGTRAVRSRCPCPAGTPPDARRTSRPGR
jgi:hypothetical protein